MAHPAVRYNRLSLRDPLLAPLAAIAAGILVSRFTGFEIRELVPSIAALLLLGLIGTWRRARLLPGACVLLALFFAGALTDVLHRPGPAPELDAEGPVTISGCVVEPPALAGDRERFVLEIEPGARAQVSLYLREGEQPPDLAYGQRVDLDAKVRRPRNFLNPGGFDYVRYLARRNIYWTASATGPESLRRLPGSCGNAFGRIVARLRTAALTSLERLYRGQPYETGMTEALLIGETSKLEKVWTENFRSTGTFHALVISGTHVAVLAAFLLLVLRLCFVPRGAALFLTMLAAWLYAVVTGWQAPCVRSAAGFMLFLAGGYLYRERRLMNVLAAVAIGFLAFDPEQMFEPSFQLSFLAVGFIGAFAAPLLQRTTAPLARGLTDLADTDRDLHLPPRVAAFRVEMRLLAETLRLWTRMSERACLLAIAIPLRLVFYVSGLVLISAVVQLGLALPMVVYFHRVGFSGLSANAFVVPLMEFAVPAGFVAIFTGWHWAAAAAGALLRWSQVIVDWHARLEPNWRIPTPPVWLGVALAAALVAVPIARRRWRPPVIAATAVLLGLLLWHPFAPKVAPGHLEMTALDVGQGDSILVTFPNGRVMVMDGGGIPVFGHHRPSQLDIGEDVVAPYLWSRSIRRIDVLALSHAHEDHIGGLPALLRDFEVGELWTGATPDSPEWIALRKLAARRGVRVVPLRRGDCRAFGAASIDVLAPAVDYQPGAQPHNNDSLTLRLKFGRHSFLLTGDIEGQVETELVLGSLVGKTDVLKVAHHGSKTSSSDRFLDAAQPAVGVVSVGFDNFYHHPHPDVVARYAERHIALLRTDAFGLVSVSTDGKRLSLDTGRWMRTSGLYRAF